MSGSAARLKVTDALNQFHSAGANEGVSASYATGSRPPYHRASTFGALSSGSYVFCTANLCSVISFPVSSELATFSRVQS